MNLPTQTAVHEPEWKRLARLALPIAAMNLGTQLMAVVDTALSGRIGALAQAGTGLGSTVFFFGALLGMGLVMGMDPLAAQAIGAGRTDRARSLLWQGGWLALAVSIPLLAAVWAAGRGLESIGVSHALAGEARVYMDARLLSLPPMLAMAAMRSYLQAVHRVMPLLVASLIANVFNVFANWVLIFGDEGLASFGVPPIGLPALGVAGIGYATVMATVLQTILMAWVIAREPGGARVDRAPHAADLATIVRYGLPLGVHMTAEIGIFTLAGLMAGRMGRLEMASHQVALNLAALTFMVPMGIGQAASVRVGHAIGARDPERLRTAAYSSVIMGAGFMSAAAVSMWTIPHLYAGVMAVDPGVVELASSLIVIAGAFQLFDGIQIVSAGALRGAGLTRWTMTANLFAYWAVGVPLLFGLSGPGGLGVRGIWVALTIGLFTGACLLLAKLRSVVENGNVDELAVAPAS